ncbi:MAG TPA: polysaccharide biosynthesis/export family protein, partial [Candidatus Angelobacter sp.]|nr:polysaccharide biosynthesis/export family protein [Candidatus Angelobacter sp.]
MRSSRLPIFQLSILLFGILLLAASQLFGQASDRAGPVQPKPQQQQEAAPATIPSEEYIICADDLLDIYIIDVPELSRTYRVSQSGQLNFPLLPKPLNATGLTLDEFARLL